MVKDYKYDVAFSFLQQDEDLAMAINELLQERLNTFIYSEKQKEIAGTDGEITLNAVFGKEARIVVVLYRSEWGDTSWTRIEQTAIRNRAFEEGYDFVIFVPLDDSPLPEWLPRTHVWVGIERWGLESAAAVIEARVQEAGVIPRQETVEDRAKQLGREIAFEKEKKKILGSEQGVELAIREFEKLVKELERVVSSVSELQLIKDNAHTCRLLSEGFSLLINRSFPYSNSMENSALYLYLFSGYAPGPGQVSFSKRTKISETELQFDLDRSMKPLWKEGTGKTFATIDLAKQCVSILLERVRDSMK